MASAPCFIGSIADYRVNLSPSAAISTVFTLHNQTLNVWTHLLGAVSGAGRQWRRSSTTEGRAAASAPAPQSSRCLGAAPARAFSSQVYFFYMTAFHWKVPSDAIDALCVYFLIGASMACFTSSALYHTMLSVSDNFAKHFLTLDVVCIMVLILASFVAGLRVGFYCNPTLAREQSGLARIVCSPQLLAQETAARGSRAGNPLPICCLIVECALAVGYFVVTATLLGMVIAQLVVPSLRNNPTLEQNRSLFIAAVVGWGLIPASHWMIAGPDELLSLAAGGLGVMFFFYGLGFLVFALHIPERFLPGKFDLFFASHQWWHVAVFLAALAWTNTVIEAYNRFLSKVTCEAGSMVISPTPVLHH